MKTKNQTTAHQRISASAHQRISASAHQRINLGECKLLIPLVKHPSKNFYYHNFKAFGILIVAIFFSLNLKLQAKPFVPPTPIDNTIDTVLLESYLKALAVGLMNIDSIDNVQRVLYAETDLCVDRYYHIDYDSLIAKVWNEYRLDIKPAMNQSIKAYYKLSNDSDYIGGMFAYFNSFNNPYRPQIAIPHYETLQRDGLLYPRIPQLGWFFFEDDYPLHCINCETSLIEKSQAHSSVTWFVTLGPRAYYFTNGDPFIFITNCTASTQLLSSGNACQNCSGSTAVGGAPIVGGGTVNYELQIHVKALDASKAPSQLDNCLVVSPLGAIINSPFPLGNYAILSKISGYDYFKMITYPIDEEQRIIKMAHPIIDFDHFYNTSTGTYNISMEGDMLSLCENINGFEAMNVTPTVGYQKLARYTNAYGGLYKITRPGVPGLKPLYFSFPYTSGMWYNGSPDMTVNYNNLIDLNNNPCFSGRRAKLEDFAAGGCTFCTAANLSMGIPTADVTKYLVSTDYNFINDFWSDNVITVGLKPYALSGSVAGNHYDFFASNTTVTSCANIPSGLITLQTCSLHSSGEYDIQKIVKFNNASIAVGETLYVQVTANFQNGEFINDTQCVTVNNYPIRFVIVQIRGNIKDYNATAVNYEVKILKQ